MINPSSLSQLYCDVYIDDVSLVEMELPAYAGNDTNIVVGGSVFIGREPDVGLDYACQWYQLPNDSVPIDTVAGLWVKPTVKTTYVVRQQLWCSGVKWDTVTVHFNTVGMGDEWMKQVELYPNPVKDELSIRGIAAVPFSIAVTDVAGKVIHQQTVLSKSPTWQLGVSWPQGLYFVKIGTAQGTVTRKVVVQR